MNAPAKRAARTTSSVRLEIGLGLAGEADDDVGRDGRVGHRRAYPLDDPEIALRPVAAAHPAQHVIGAGLQRHVQRRADVRGLGHRGDHVVGEVAGMRGGEPHPFEPVDAARSRAATRRTRRVAEAAAVGVHVLAEQRDLQDPLLDQGLHLGQHVARPPVALAAAQARHDAEGAGVVAADADAHPGAGGRVAPGRQHARKDLERFVDLDLGLGVVPGALEQRRQAPDVVGAEDDVDPRRALDQRTAILLGEAAADRDLHAGMGVLDRTQVAEIAVEPVVGVLAYRAGVEDDQVGLRRPSAAT